MKFDKIENHVSGRRVLHHVVLEKTWDILEDNGIKDSDFRGKAKITLDFIRDYFNESDGEFPPEDFVVEETNIPWPSKIAVHAAIKKLKDWAIVKDLGPLINQAQEFLAKQQPHEAMQVLSKVSNIRESYSTAKSVNETAVERQEDFKKEDPDKGIGIIPPFESWANNIVSFAPSTLNMVLGISSVGKSWLSAAAAVHAAYTQGAQVLLISKENTEKSMHNRIDGIYHALDFGDLRTRVMDDRMVKRWQLSAEKMEKERGDIWVKDSKEIRTVADIQQQVISKKPDFVIVDGAYKLAGTDWKESSALIQDLCDYSGAGTAPWFATSQLNLDANNEKSGREQGYNARGNKGFYIDVDTVLTVTQTPELALLNNVIECKIAKDREAGDKTNVDDTFHLQMDMRWTKISEIDLNTYEDEEAMSLTQ